MKDNCFQLSFSGRRMALFDFHSLPPCCWIPQFDVLQLVCSVLSVCFLRLFRCVVVLVGVSPFVTASTLRDNKIDIHVSVTINTSTPSVSPALPALPALPVPPAVPPAFLSVSGVACTLADLKRHRSQSRILVTTPSQLPVAPCSVNSLQSAFPFPAVGTLNETANGVSSSSTSSSTNNSAPLPAKPVSAHYESIASSTSKFPFQSVLFLTFGKGISTNLLESTKNLLRISQKLSRILF